MKAAARSRRARSLRKEQTSAPEHPPWEGSAHSAEDRPAHRAVHLTAREREVLALMCEGLSNKIIGRHLKISPSTVKVHVSKILRALNVSSRLQAILLTHSSRLIGERVNHSDHAQVSGRKPHR